jgi:hypothetical protein
VAERQVVALADGRTKASPTRPARAGSAPSASTAIPHDPAASMARPALEAGAVEDARRRRRLDGPGRGRGLGGTGLPALSNDLELSSRGRGA